MSVEVDSGLAADNVQIDFAGSCFLKGQKIYPIGGHVDVDCMEETSGADFDVG